jgi:hypothetical protein
MAMSLLYPEEFRRSAERCRRKALGVDNSKEWDCFFQDWENIASMSERLLAADIDPGERDRGADARGSTG